MTMGGMTMGGMGQMGGGMGGEAVAAQPPSVERSRLSHSSRPVVGRHAPPAQPGRGEDAGPRIWDGRGRREGRGGLRTGRQRWAPR